MKSPGFACLYTPNMSDEAEWPTWCLIDTGINFWTM